MERNLGYIDRFIRIIIGAVLIVFYAAGLMSGVTSVVLLVAGIIIMVTALLGFCPVYSIFKINTCSLKRQ
jgi:hypothetical protein